MTAASSFIDALHAPHPASARADKLGIYDPNIDAWHILWSDPLRQVYTRQIGRAHGDGIVQDGKNDAGEPVRWSFTEITPNSFRWRGERSRDGGASWQLQAEFFARRAAAQNQTNPRGARP